jgi:myo-inositol 2-dehydrogenase/D-chiro-inositol 1-dehydrogenase
MFAEEIVAAQVLTPRRSRNSGELRDPLVLLLETESGILVDVEISVNIRYGYDIRGEVVCEEGTAALGEPSLVRVRRAGTVADRVPADWQERFARAYDVELQEWVDAVGGDGELGPSSWDGYAAAVVSDAGLQALRTGERVPVSVGDRPALYEK